MPYEILNGKAIQGLDDVELDEEIEILVAEIEAFSSERYDSMCEALAYMRNQQGLRKARPNRYLIVSPRHESGAARVYGPATLDACQYEMIVQGQADYFDFQVDHQNEVVLEDNYTLDTANYCMEIVKISPMPETL